MKARLEELQAKVDFHEQNLTGYSIETENNSLRPLLISPAASEANITFNVNRPPPEVEQEQLEESQTIFHEHWDVIDTTVDVTPTPLLDGSPMSPDQPQIKSLQALGGCLMLQPRTTIKGDYFGDGNQHLQNLDCIALDPDGMNYVASQGPALVHQVVAPIATDLTETICSSPGASTEFGNSTHQNQCNPNLGHPEVYRTARTTACSYVSPAPTTEAHVTEDAVDLDFFLTHSNAIPSRHRPTDESIESILETIEAVGFRSFDSLVATYYSATFDTSSTMYNEQRLSRCRRLPAALSEIFDSSADWAPQEQQRFNDELIRMVETMLVAEGHTFPSGLGQRLNTLMVTLNTRLPEAMEHHLLRMKEAVMTGVSVIHFRS